MRLDQCPFYLGTGTCGNSCWYFGEPVCWTEEPAKGWKSYYRKEKFRDLGFRCKRGILACVLAWRSGYAYAADHWSRLRDLL